MRNTIPKYSAFLLFISIVILFSCRKFDAFKNKEAPEEKFSVAAAKEWFYGKFKKSASYSEEVESIFSLHTVAVTARRKQYRKYPLWNQAVAYRNGDMSVVEAPLFMEANTILLPGMQAATAAERKRVAAATLHKVVLVQTGTQQMDVRIISIIPTLEYLQAHSYDISNNTARSVAPDFEGFYVVRGWNNSVYRFLEVKQGKIVRSVTIVTTGSRVAAQRTSHTDPAAAMQNSSGMCGEWVWVPYLQQVCVRTALCEGDIPCPELPCEEWEEIEKYRLEFQVDPDCVGGGGPGGGGTGDPFGDCLLTGTDYNTCLCWIWGICEGDGGGGGQNDECENNCNNLTTQLIYGSHTASETVNIQLETIDAITKFKNPKWKILQNLTWALYSQEQGIIKLVDPLRNIWQWESLSHGQITKEGFTLGGTISFSQGVGTPSFTPGTQNVLIAGMQLDFDVTYTPVCSCPVITDIIPPITISYSSNQFWAANP